MSPTCSKAALRVLVSVLLASSIASAVALPHQVLDARAPELQIEGVPLADAVQGLAAASSDVPENIFKEIGDLLNLKSGYNWFLDLFTKLFGPSDDSDDGPDTTTTMTVLVTPTPTPVESLTSAVGITPTPTSAELTSSALEATPSSSIILPPGPSSTSSEASSVSITSAESPAVSSTTTISSSADFHILPVGNMSTYINATTLTPIFVTAPETTTASFIPVIPPYPANSTSAGVLPTAASITGQFSVNSGYPSAPSPVPSVSAGLSLPWAGNWSYPAINPTLILTNPIQPTPSPSSSATSAVNTTSTTVSFTSITVILQTVFPSPILSTGTGPSVSAGTGSPIGILETPKWTNTTTCTTEVTSETLIALPGIGTGAPISVDTAAPVASYSESPLYPNTTSTSVTPSGTGAPVFVTQVPLTVIGTAGSVVSISVSLPSAPYPNSTVSTPDAILSTGAPVASILPVFSSDSTYFNTTTTLGVPLESATAAPISVGTIAPVLSISEIPLYPNTTTAIITEITVSTGTAVIVLPPVPTPSDAAVEFPGLLALRSICSDPKIRVITLPLLNRFYGPHAYPSLFSFPGCTSPNARQSIQAPGLLDCSALGVEVQSCQAAGKKVLLSVKGDGFAAVGGNANFGDPNASDGWLGPYFGEAGIEKRQKVGVGKPWGIDVPTISLDVPSSTKIEEISTSTEISAPVSTSLAAFSWPSASPVVSSLVPTSSEEPFSILISYPPSPSASTSSLASSTAVAAESFSILISYSPPEMTPSFRPIGNPESSPTQHIEVPSPRPWITGPPGIPLGPGPVIFNNTPPVANATSSSTPTTMPAPVNIPIETPILIMTPPLSTSSAVAEPSPVSPAPVATPSIAFPNLFDSYHPASAFALTVSSLFGETHTERADLRPLGPDAPSGSSPNGIEWINPILTIQQRPLGEEVVLDGFDVQLPAEWQGTYQDKQFKALVKRLQELESESWKESGGIEGGKDDLGADGEGVVYFGWIEGGLRKRESEGWVEWDGGL